MAKRARGSHRPGQRAPLQRTTSRPAAPSSTAAVAARPASLTPEEEARAAELEAQLLDQERAADDARRRSTERGRTRTATPEPVVRSTLAANAAEEYAYVGRDVRRITLVGGSLILLLIVLSVISHLTGAGPV
jgi:hypothetical protein